MNQCKKIYQDMITQRKTVGIMRPGLPSDYKVLEGIDTIKRYYHEIHHKIVQTLNQPKRYRTEYGYGLVLGEEIYYLKNIPKKLCQNLGWNFTSVFKNLQYCKSVDKATFDFINTFLKARIDRLATMDLEEVRLRLKQTPAAILRKELKSGIDSTGLFKAIHRTESIADQLEELIT